MNERITFIYPGQGSQRIGMGAALRSTDGPTLDRRLELAEDIAQLPIRRLCREGPIEELTRTEVSQPALLAFALALTDVAADVGLRPSFVAGHSVGEYAAAVAAGAIDAEAGMLLVVRRGRLMATRQAEQPGAMAALIGLTASAAADLCGEVARAWGPVVVANINSQEQVVVSGVRAAVLRVGELARGSGARVVVLPVGGAFHSPLMEPVRAAMSAYADALPWRAATVPLAANVSGALIYTGGAVRDALVHQIATPVRWSECVRTLVDAGCVRFVELGGGVLTGLVRAAAPGVAASPAESRRQLQTLADEITAPGGQVNAARARRARSG
jgi:[acyl-carrier-protein] S-malonyltransferase